MASGRPGAPMMGPWSDLPSSDLPGLVIARPRALPRRVPRLALRPAPPPRRFSRWIVLPDGTFVTVSNDGGGVHRMPFRRPAALGGGRNRQQQVLAPRVGDEGAARGVVRSACFHGGAVAFLVDAADEGLR
uniref:Uncharacterized protein n=1 Tax=Oryza glumipatula TaxID=40148 RepID=A0A0E0AK83_9ORYZ